MNTDTYELTVGRPQYGHRNGYSQGLFVPVCKNIEQKSILHIAAEMATRTRAGQASMDDLTEAFTITSVGNIGGVLATPILNVPESSSWASTRFATSPGVDGEICIRKMFYVSPSFDHRIIDGAVAARFIARLKELLESPESLLLELS